MGFRGRVDDDEAGARCDEREHLVGVEREVLLLQQRDWNRGGAAEADRGLVDREARVRVEDLRPRLAEHHHREEHRHLAAGDDDDPVRMHLDPAVAHDVRRDRLADPRDSRRRGIAVMAVAQRPRARLDDVGRRLEVRLTDTEVDDVVPRARKRLGPSQDLERGLGAEHRHPPCLLHQCPPGINPGNHSPLLAVLSFCGHVQADGFPRNRESIALVDNDGCRRVSSCHSRTSPAGPRARSIGARRAGSDSRSATIGFPHATQPMDTGMIGPECSLRHRAPPSTAAPRGAGRRLP